MITTWMLYAAIIAVCLSCLAWVVDSMLRANGRATRWVWASAVLASVFVPLGVAVRPRIVESSPSNGTQSIGVELGGATSTTTTGSGGAVGWLWLGSSSATLILLVAGLAQLARVRRRASRQTMAGRTVAVTHDLGPGAVPFGEPKILIPRWAMDLPPDAARLLVTHEEEHVRAGDARLLLAAALAVVVMPWNASLWWCFRRLRTAIELDCDARVLRREPAVAPYAELLLHVAQCGRPALLPAMLPLTDGATQLHLRIDAMTIRPRLTGARRLALGALAAAATLAACEIRRPAPVAPVTDFVVRDGQATATTAKAQPADSVKARVLAGLPAGDAGAADDVSKPLIIVDDATGNVVYSGRMEGNMEATLNRISPESIERVEVVKRGDLLPPEAKGGIIRITLKRGATWPGATADSAKGLKYRSPGSVSAHRDTMSGSGTNARIASGDTTTSGSSGSIGRGGDTLRVTGTSARAATGDAIRFTANSDGRAFRSGSGPVPSVILVDANGMTLYEGLVESGSLTDTFGPYRVLEEGIDRVEVTRPRGGQRATIRVLLKPGVVPERVR